MFGGDVYAIDHSGIERTYENWYCDKKAGESSDDFVQRSCAEATQYISQLQYSKMANSFVTLVISESLMDSERGNSNKGRGFG